MDSRTFIRPNKSCIKRDDVPPKAIPLQNLN